MIQKDTKFRFFERFCLVLCLFVVFGLVCLVVLGIFLFVCLVGFFYCNETRITVNYCMLKAIMN